MEEHNDLFWALGHLAQLQATPMDRLRLQAGVAAMKQAKNDAHRLKLLCDHLDWRSPVLLAKPDPAALPFLLHLPDQGWFVVTEYAADGSWRVAHENEQRALNGAQLKLGQIFYIHTQSPFDEDDEAQNSFKGALRRSLKSYRNVIVESALATFFIGLIALVISMFSMQVYDRVIPTRSQSTLVTLATGVLLAITLEWVMKNARSKIMEVVAAGMDKKLSRVIFERLLGVRLDQLPGAVGSLAAQVRSYEQVRSYYTSSTLFAFVDFPQAILFLVIMAAVGHPLVVLPTLVFGSLGLYLGLRARKQIKRQAEAGTVTSNAKTGLLVEAVEGAETIKSGSGGWKFLSRWININAKSMEGDLEMKHISDDLSYKIAAVQQMSYISLVCIGASLVINGDMTNGSLLACTILGGRALNPIMTLPNLLVQRAHAVAAEDSLEKLFQLKQDNDGIDRPLTPKKVFGSYDLQQVSFAYGDIPPSISIAQLEIKPGERIGILGPIGSGKSTLIKLLAGLYKPQKGQILLDGLDLFHVSRRVISHHIGYLQQDHRLFQGTLRENLLIGVPDPGDDEMRRALERSGLIKLVAGHPKGLELPIAEGGKGLSGGQKQLVVFTRFLLTKPKVLLLDEPTASMDYDTEARCRRVLREELEDPTRSLVLVTHKPQMLELVNRLIVVANRRIVMDGPRSVILNKLSKGPESKKPKAESAPSAPAVTPVVRPVVASGIRREGGIKS